MLYFPKLLLNVQFYVEMYLEFKNYKKLFPVIRTCNKKIKTESGRNGEELFTPLLPPPTLPSCIYSDCNYFIH